MQLHDILFFLSVSVHVFSSESCYSSSDLTAQKLFIFIAINIVITGS